MMMAVKYFHLDKHSFNTIFLGTYIHCVVEFNVYDDMNREDDRSLFSIIDRKGEIEVKTLTNTIHPIKNRETFLLCSLFVSRKAHHEPR